MEGFITVLTSWSEETVAALVLLYILLKAFKTVIHTAWRRPPGPPAWPVIGHYQYLKSGLPHHSLTKIAEQYGPIVWLQLGAVGAVIVSSSDMAREILKTQDHIFASRPAGIIGDTLFAKGQDLLFSPLNDNFRLARKIFTTELLSQQRVDSFKGLRRELVLKTMRTALEEGHANRYLNLSDLLHDQSMSLSTRMLYRMDGHAQNKELIEIIRDLSSTGFLVKEEYFPLLKLLDLSGQLKKLKKLSERYFDLMDSIIDNRLKETTKSKSNTEEDFLDVLLAKSNISRVQIKVLLLDIILAGGETIPDTIVWAMTELLRHPNVMERLQNELDDVIGKERLVEESDLKKLEYLQAVVKETLRLHPVGVLGVPHVSIEATKVAGYDIPASTRVMVNFYAIGRDPKVWENPLKFDPSRFLNSPIDVKGQQFEVLPFSSGRRKCPGMHLALVSVSYTLAQLIHACTVSLPEGFTHLDLDLEEKFGMSVSKKNPLNLLIQKRLPSDVYGRTELNVSGQ
ncbi:protein MpCYP829-like13 [Marchantia polymorpha subsp. ruderalis]